MLFIKECNIMYRARSVYHRMYDFFRNDTKYYEGVLLNL